jgi:hypothetical protein
VDADATFIRAKMGEQVCTTKANKGLEPDIVIDHSGLSLGTKI